MRLGPECADGTEIGRPEDLHDPGRRADAPLPPLAEG
jgi:hypothetical protein